MARSTLLGETRSLRLSNLLEMIYRGEIRVPRFQRPFVWMDEQRRALVDSIYRGYPIGGLIVWYTREHRLQTYDHIGPLRLPEDRDDGLVQQYLLDGHQRIATLFGALGPGLHRSPHGEPSMRIPVDEEEMARWPIYFDLESGMGELQDEIPFRLRRRGEPLPPTWVPLDILFDGYALLEFTDGLRTRSYPRELFNRAQAVATTFRDYTIPVTSFVTEDFGQVVTSFWRINSGGTPMSEVHMMQALTYSTDFDLLARLDEVVSDLLPREWQGIEPRSIIDICKGRLGLPVYHRDLEELARTLKANTHILGEVAGGIARAADILDKIAAVHGPESLPYMRQMVLLADAVGGATTISTELLANLRIWFWATTLGEYFSGISQSALERARHHLQQMVEGEAPALPPGLQIVIEPVDRFDFRSPRARGLALLLAEQKPASPDGTIYDAFETLAEYGAGALPRLLSEHDVAPAYRDLVNGVGNRLLVHPKSAWALRDLLRGTPMVLGKPGERESHLLYSAVWEALERRDWSTFLALRRAALEDMEQSRAEECGMVYRRRGGVSSRDNAAPTIKA